MFNTGSVVHRKEATLPKRTTLVLSLALLVALPAAAQDFQKGRAAYARGDYAAALKVWRPLAAKGDAKAQYNLGVLYQMGLGVPQDRAAAVKWYRKAAKQGDAKSQTFLGIMYQTGRGVPKDSAEAVKWYRKAAERGHVFAQNNLGHMYDKGLGVPPDYSQAAKWFRKAAEQGDAKAQYKLAHIYLNGRGVPQDYILAYMWASLSSANDYKGGSINEIAQRMTPGEIAKAQKLEREWLERRPKGK